MVAVIDLFRKTHAFHSNHISHETRIARDANPFPESPFLCITSIHHSTILAKPFQAPMSRSGSPSHVFKDAQILLVMRHWKNRCTPNFLILLQSLQRPKFSHPLRLSLSAVHTQFWKINHAKILHLGDCQGFQTNLGIIDVVCPKNFILYDDFED